MNFKRRDAINHRVWLCGCGAQARSNKNAESDTALKFYADSGMPIGGGTRLNFPPYIAR